MRSCRNSSGKTNRTSLFMGTTRDLVLLKIKRRFSKCSDDGGRRALEERSISLMNLISAEWAFRWAFPFPDYSGCDHNDSNRCNL